MFRKVLSILISVSLLMSATAITAGAKYILDKMDDKFLEEVKVKGEYIREKVTKMPHVEGVDGMGLMLGIRISEGIKSADIVKKGIEYGALLLTAKAKVRLLPPLTITYEEIDKGLEVLRRALESY